MAASWPDSERALSVSSSLSRKRPPNRRASSQLKNAVRTFPRCKRPVGLGAKRVTTGLGMAAQYNGFDPPSHGALLMPSFTLARRVRALGLLAAVAFGSV